MRRQTRDPAELIPLKHSTYQVLLALGDGEAMHGYAIMQAVSAMTDGREAILPGTLYAALASPFGVDSVPRPSSTIHASVKSSVENIGPRRIRRWRSRSGMPVPITLRHAARAKDTRAHPARWASSRSKASIISVAYKSRCRRGNARSAIR